MMHDQTKIKFYTSTSGMGFYKSCYNLAYCRGCILYLILPRLDEKCIKRTRKVI